MKTDQLSIGQLITGEAHRDAIHIAVAPVVAGQFLEPGHPVCLKDGKAFYYSGEDCLGIVDPFLPHNSSVLAGERFWLFLTPYTITSLRHEWEHPAFVEEKQKESLPTFRPVGKAIQELTAFAARAGMSYTDLLASVKQFLGSGVHLCEGGRWYDVYFTDDLWDHYETVTGEKVPSRDRGGVFSCAC